MKGIILAGGSGTRLAPMTEVVSKQLLPIYDKPTIYYPLAVLMEAGIRDILIISTPRDLPLLKQLLGTGHDVGIDISYAEQPKPEGIAQAFIIAKKFIAGDRACLILGDNIFYGDGVAEACKNAIARENGATVFAYRVNDPERYGVVKFSENGKAEKIVEKPKSFVSSWAVPGIYFYDEKVVSIAEKLKPSQRGELEITDVSNTYLEMGSLYVEKLSRGVAWLDTGTPDAMHAAATFVKTIEDRQGFKVACIEEIALKKGYINLLEFKGLCDYYKNSYGDYLRGILRENDI